MFLKKSLLFTVFVGSSLVCGSQKDEQKAPSPKKEDVSDKKGGLPAPKPAHKPIDKIVSLQDFLQKAYDESLNLMASRYERKSKDASLLNALSGFAPSVSVGVSNSRSKQSSNLSDTSNLWEKNPSPQPFTNSDKFATTAGLQARWNLFNFGADVAKVSGAMAEQDLHDLTYVENVNKFIMNAIGTYIEVLSKREELSIRDKLEKQASFNVEKVNTEYIVGHGTKTALLSAKSDLANATSNRMKTQAELSNAEQGYLVLVGTLPGKLQVPANNLKMPVSLDEALKIGETRNTSLLKGSAQKRSAQYGVSASVAAAMPSVDLVAGYSKDLMGNNQNNASLGIECSYQLLSNSRTGGNHVANINSAINANTAASYALDYAKKAAVQEVTVTWHEWEATKSQMRFVQSSVEAGRAAYDAALTEFKLGSRAYLDFLKVQEQYLNAELSFLNTQKAEILGRYKLLAAMGMLTPTSIGITPSVDDTSRGVQHD